MERRSTAAKENAPLVNDPDQASLRPALLFEPGRPAEGLPSLLGGVNLARQGEEWPRWQGRALQPLLQLDLADLPYRPSGLGQVGFLTLFIGWDLFGPKDPNGTTWCLRTYREAEPLITLDAPTDLPPLGVVALAEPYLFEDQRESPQSGVKLGGWPHACLPDPAAHVFQLDTTPLGTHHQATIAVTRGTARSHSGEWSLFCSSPKP